jgi:hypothetical protein
VLVGVFSVKWVCFIMGIIGGYCPFAYSGRTGGIRLSIYAPPARGIVVIIISFGYYK